MIDYTITIKTFYKIAQDPMRLLTTQDPITILTTHVYSRGL